MQPSANAASLSPDDAQVVTAAGKDFDTLESILQFMSHIPPFFPPFMIGSFPSDVFTCVII